MKVEELELGDLVLIPPSISRVVCRMCHVAGCKCTYIPKVVAVFLGKRYEHKRWSFDFLVLETSTLRDCLYQRVRSGKIIARSKEALG